MNILGPVWYNRIEYKGKVIHNFGDIHNKETPCADGIPFNQWLVDFIKKQAGIIDVFFELPPPQKKHPYRYPVEFIEESFIRDLYLSFLPCITRIGEIGEKSIRDPTCPFPHTRFHMTDIRLRFLEGGYQLPIEEATNELYRLIHTSAEKRKEIMERFESLYLHLQLRERRLIRSELDELFSYIQSHEDDLYLTKLRKVSMLMDLFLLIRICRTYDTEKRNDFMNQPVTVAVSYLGVNHAISLSSLFKKLGGIVSIPIFEIEQGKYKQCIRNPFDFKQQYGMRKRRTKKKCFLKKVK